VFRDPLYIGRRGRPPLIVWDDLQIVQMLKQGVGRRLRSVTRRLAYGSLEQAKEVVQRTQVELSRINTAYIERLNQRYAPGYRP
jgi:hypothetical protein